MRKYKYHIALHGLWEFLWLSVFILCGAAAAAQEAESRRLARPMMGTIVEIVWRDHDEAKAADKVRSAMDKMAAMAASMNLHDPGSELSNINKAAGKSAVKISDDLFEVITKSLEVSRLTTGAFDISIGSLEKIWGNIQWGRGGRRPLEEEIRQTLSIIHDQHIKVDQTQKTVFFEDPGIRLDLGGIAKGYIVDYGLECLKRKGFKNVLINAGGDIRATGTMQAPLWRIGVQNPFEKEKLLGVSAIRNGAVVTSGTYERFFEVAGETYSHVLNPATGHPVKSVVSVTVFADKAAYADALATALMVLGREEGISLLRKLPSVHGLLVEESGTIWMDEDLKEVLKLKALPQNTSINFFQ